MTSLARETGPDDLNAEHIQAFPLGGVLHTASVGMVPVPVALSSRCCLVQIWCAGADSFLSVGGTVDLPLHKDVLYTYAVAPGATLTFSCPMDATVRVLEAP